MTVNRIMILAAIAMHFSVAVAQNQYTEKNLTIFTFFVVALCYVQKCELSYNILGMTQNCIPPSEIFIPNRECVIRLDIGEGVNVIFKQVSRAIRYPVVAFL